MHCSGNVPSANTITSVKNAIAKAGHFNFALDLTRIGGFHLDATLKSSDYLHLICTERLGDGTQCGHPVRHTVGNIKHALKKPGHLRCQGRCDGKKKGKARRVSLNRAQEELAAARGGAWTIIEETYKKKSQPVQLVHGPCGNAVTRKLCHALDFPIRAGLPASTDADCPYCSGRSARVALGGDGERYSAWLAAVTQGKLKYISGSIAPQDRETVPLDVECQVCGSVFSALESQLIFSDFCGCKKCLERHSRQLRAWVLSDAQKVVARRGFILEDDPSSYTKPARIVTSNGELTGYSTILELVQAFPAKADGFGIPEKPVWDTSNTGRPFTAEEVSAIRMAHQRQLSKSWLCRQLRRTVGSVNQKCKRLGLRFDQWEHVNRRVLVDDKFFSDLSVRNCYWAGLLAADGCLAKDITIELKVVDEVVLQQFMAELGHTGTLTYRTMRNVAGRGLYAALRFRSQQIRADLQTKFRLTSRKSLTLLPPDLREPLHVLAYACGLFEGDGHVRVSRDGLVAQVCTASLELANWLQQMMLAIGVKANFRLATARGGILYELTWNGSCAEKLLTALAEAVDGTMDRKWAKFRAYLECKNTK